MCLKQIRGITHQPMLVTKALVTWISFSLEALGWFLFINGPAFETDLRESAMFFGNPTKVIHHPWLAFLSHTLTYNFIIFLTSFIPCTEWLYMTEDCTQLCIPSPAVMLSWTCTIMHVHCKSEKNPIYSEKWFVHLVVFQSSLSISAASTWNYCNVSFIQF